jgi:hypothetical protein
VKAGVAQALILYLTEKYLEKTAGWKGGRRAAFHGKHAHMR